MNSKEKKIIKLQKILQDNRITITAGDKSLLLLSLQLLVFALSVENVIYPDIIDSL